jgi:hypothetical protein
MPRSALTPGPVPFTEYAAALQSAHFGKKHPPAQQGYAPRTPFPAAGHYTRACLLSADQRPQPDCRCAGRGSAPFSPVQAPQDDPNDIHREYTPLTTQTTVVQRRMVSYHSLETLETVESLVLLHAISGGA